MQTLIFTYLFLISMVFTRNLVANNSALIAVFLPAALQAIHRLHRISTVRRVGARDLPFINRTSYFFNKSVSMENGGLENKQMTRQARATGGSVSVLETFQEAGIHKRSGPHVAAASFTLC